MSQLHQIDTTVFDVTYGQAGFDAELRSELDDFIKTDALNVIEDVLNKCCTADEVIRIPSMVIDLGDILYSKYKTELPQLIRDKLVSELGNIQKSSNSEKSTDHLMMDKNIAATQELFYFLLNGHMPWYSKHKSLSSLENLLNLTINLHAALLVNFLHKNVHNFMVIDRLLNQFSNQAIFHVFGKLTSCDSITIQNCVSELKTILARSTHTSDTYTISPDTIIRNVLRNIMFTVIKNPDEFVSHQVLFAKAIKDSVNLYSQAESNKVTKYINRLINQNATEDNTKNSSVDLLYDAFVNALESADSQAVVLSWNLLYSKNRSLLRKIVKKYTQKLTFRQILANALPQKNRSELLNLLEPVHAPYIAAVITNAELFSPIDSNTDYHISEPQSQLWLLSLECILIEHTNGFNKKEFILSLLKRLAAHRNQTTNALLNTIQRNISKNDPSKKLSNEVIQTFLNTESDLSVTQLHKRLDHDSNKLHELESVYERYEYLLTAFTNGVTHSDVNESILLKDVELLSLQYPWLLMRFSRVLQTADNDWLNAIKSFSLLSLQHLVEAFLLIDTNLESQLKTDLSNRIKLKTDSSSITKHAFLYFIKCLVNHQTIDFDLLSKTLPADKSLVQLSESEHDQTDPEMCGISAYKSLIQHFKPEKCLHLFFDMLSGEVLITQQTKLKICLLGAHLSKQYPQLLCQQFRRRFYDKLFILNLSQNIPESLQLKLLSISGVTDYTSGITIIELINIACMTFGLSISDKQLAAIKWQFIYNYISDTGSVFNEAVFVSSYVDTILSKVNASPVNAELTNTHAIKLNQFNTELSQALRQNTLLSTKKMSEKIILTLTRKTTHTLENYHEEVFHQPSTDMSLDKSTTNEVNIIADDIYIDNSGIVLAAVYLPRLFSQLGLTKDSVFIHRGAAVRAVHIIQFLVNEQCASPEFQLVINKILCGIKPASPICRATDLTVEDKEQLENLLRSMIKHWKAIGKTSINGFRQSFMQRHGRLQFKNDNWHLVVEPKSFDLLLDSIPWSYTTIKLPWMDHILYVEWR